ncbi:MAG: UDP-N-acetylmuramate dehydrogenase [Bacteroidota bacterium]
MQVSYNHPLKNLHTFGVEAYAKEFILIEKSEDILHLLSKDKSIDLILGGGSNVFFLKDFDGCVVKNNILGIHIIQEDENNAIVEIGGGENWHEIVIWAVNNNLGGIENLALIPGSVGAAPVQNIGAYGVELKDVFFQLKAIDLLKGEEVSFTKDECQFAYRDSLFKHQKGRYFITHVQLKLTKQNHKLNTSYKALYYWLADSVYDEIGIAQIMEAVIDIRSSKLPDPNVIGNAGSFFKNPIIPIDHLRKLQVLFPDIVYYPVDDDTHVKLPAAWLIDKAGFKGKRDGAVGSYEKQALVIVNHGGASGTAIDHWAKKIEAKVFEVYGVQLEREVNMIN